jgi:hypothetical protein
VWTPDQALLVLQGCRRICEGAAWPYQVSLHLAQTAGNGSRAGSRCRPAEAKLCQCDGKCSFCFQPKWFSSSSSSSSSREATGKRVQISTCQGNVCQFAEPQSISLHAQSRI